jgi:hypothetical protein
MARGLQAGDVIDVLQICCDVLRAQGYKRGLVEVIDGLLLFASAAPAISG